MTDLDKALGDIRSIRRQMARSTEFRGYGPLTLVSTGVLAIIAASIQADWFRYGRLHPVRFVSLWAITALLSAALIALQTLTRAHRLHSGMADEMIHLAAGQFLPAAIAGALLTFTLVHFAPFTLWMLPGLWQIAYSLGIFASCRFLPRPMLAAGVWYLLTGLACLSLAGPRALSPWMMGVPFALGQGLIALILFLNAEEGHHEA